MALPTIVAVGAVSSVVSGACTPGVHAGNLADDGQVLFVEAANEPLNAITGFTRIGSGAVVQATGLVTDLSAFIKRSVGGDTAPSITSTPQNHLTGRIVGVRGLDWTASPVNVVNVGVDNGTGTAFSIPGGTTTVADCLIFAALSTGTDVASTTKVSGWTNASLANPSITEQIDNWTTSGNGGGIGVAAGGKATAGAYNATTGTLATIGDTKAFMSFALIGATAAASSEIWRRTPHPSYRR